MTGTAASGRTGATSTRCRAPGRNPSTAGTRDGCVDDRAGRAKPRRQHAMRLALPDRHQPHGRRRRRRETRVDERLDRGARLRARGRAHHSEGRRQRHRPVDVEAAEHLVEPGRFVELVPCAHETRPHRPRRLPGRRRRPQGPALGVDDRQRVPVALTKRLPGKIAPPDRPNARALPESDAVHPRAADRPPCGRARGRSPHSRPSECANAPVGNRLSHRCSSGSSAGTGHG